jgi:hypothetical protein
MPTPTPLTKRARSRPGTSLQKMNMTAERIWISTAARMMGRRPSQSLTCPARYRLRITPTA